MDAKIPWQGTITSIQPRIRLGRSFDERYHTYLGFVLGLKGRIAEEDRDFLVAIGKVAQAKYSFQSGDEASGMSVEAADERMEVAGFYKTSRIKLIKPFQGEHPAPPPFHGIPQALEIYRERGHRRLHTATYSKKCSSCIWGCKMPVEMIIDHWNPSKKRYRFETFCYGPKSCALYKAGPKRKVPGRKGMVYEEEDWIDEEATQHRGPDE